MQGLLSPEERVALVEVVIVESQVGIALCIAQRLEDRFLRSTDTWMVHLLLMRVLQEEDVAGQPHQSVTYPQTILVATVGKECSNAPLGGTLVGKVVEVIGLAHEEVVAHIGRMDAKQAINDSVVDKRLGKQLLAEGQSEIFYLINGQRQGGREMAQHAIDSLDRNLPDAEIAQYVVDAQSIEILREAAKTEPQHTQQVLVPVIGWEAPVMAML